MRLRSFTFSFRNIKLSLVTLIAATLVSLFILDRLTFLLFFPLYDQWLRVGTSVRPSEILLVGSSHIEADFDTKLLKSLVQKDVGLFSVPGAGLTPRYYAIKQRLELKDVPKPQVIILETSKLVFNSTRYFDDVSDYLEAYGHKDLFIDYIQRFQPKHSNWLWYKLFDSYSLNGGFDKFLDPANITRFIAERTLNNDDYMKFRARFRSTHDSCLTTTAVNTADTRVADWANTRKILHYNNVIDARLVDVFRKIIALTEASGVQLILWEPPFFHFDGDSENDGFDNVRDLLKASEQKDVHYLKLSVSNNSCLFSDEGHLSQEGQELFTQAISKSI